MTRKREANKIVRDVATRLRVDVRTAAKQRIITDYCDGKITESQAMQEIRELGLTDA